MVTEISDVGLGVIRDEVVESNISESEFGECMDFEAEVEGRPRLT